MSSSAFGGQERRREESALEDIKSGIGRIASHLESETRFRDWIHQKFDEIKSAIYGNGKKGLIRDMDAVQASILDLEAKSVDIRKEIEKWDTRAEKVVIWALVSSLSSLGLILFETIMFVLRRGHQ